MQRRTFFPPQLQKFSTTSTWRVRQELKKTTTTAAVISSNNNELLPGDVYLVILSLWLEVRAQFAIRFITFCTATAHHGQTSGGRVHFRVETRESIQSRVKDFDKSGDGVAKR
jgi:hypothetical protein